MELGYTQLQKRPTKSSKKSNRIPQQKTYLDMKLYHKTQKKNEVNV